MKERRTELAVKDVPESLWATTAPEASRKINPHYDV
jgi:hypothetical protein